MVFIASLTGVGIYFTQDTVWNLGPYIRINGLSLVMITTVTFFGAVIGTYAKNYLLGFKFQHLFSVFSLGFILSVLLFVISNHAALIVLGWFFMGLCMAKLIGINSGWEEAKGASRYALRFFLSSSLLLALSLSILSYYARSLFLNDILQRLETLPLTMLLLASLLLILAGLIQSALFLFIDGCFQL